MSSFRVLSSSSTHRSAIYQQPLLSVLTAVLLLFLSASDAALSSRNFPVRGFSAIRNSWHVSAPIKTQPGAVASYNMFTTVNSTSMFVAKSKEDDSQKDWGKSKAPFYVTINNAHHYGGLITYAHQLHPAKICRVLNACLSPDGTLHLPSWMQRHDDLISFHCGLTSVDFSLPDTFPPPPLRSVDLVGVTLPHPSMSRFITDFFPSAVAFDLIYGDHSVSKACHSRKGSDCGDGFPALLDSLRAAVILPHRLRDLDEKKSWVREFVKLMKPPSSSGRQPLVIYDDTLHHPDADLTCFRSAFFTRGPFNSHTVMPDHLRNIHFLTAHNINKTARPFPSGHSVAGFPGRKHCQLNVTLSNRKLVDGALNRLVGRYVLNILDLKDAIHKQADRIPGLSLSVDTLTLEGKSLRWQINAMQKTDIWVAGHGPLLTNMIFLRDNSTVIEMQPFSYYPQTYEKMASNLANVRYDRFIAHPDLEAFDICIRQMFPPSSPAYIRAMNILDRFTGAAFKFKQSDSTHSIVLHQLIDQDLEGVKMCAQMQRLNTDATHFAIAIVRHARLMCGLPPPTM